MISMCDGWECPGFGQGSGAACELEAYFAKFEIEFHGLGINHGWTRVDTDGN